MVLATKALEPTAVLLDEVVLLCNDNRPTAVLSEPVVLFPNAA